MPAAARPSRSAEEANRNRDGRSSAAQRTGHSVTDGTAPVRPVRAARAAGPTVPLPLAACRIGPARRCRLRPLSAKRYGLRPNTIRVHASLRSSGAGLLSMLHVPYRDHIPYARDSVDAWSYTW